MYKGKKKLVSVTVLQKGMLRPFHFPFDVWEILIAMVREKEACVQTMGTGNQT